MPEIVEVCQPRRPADPPACAGNKRHERGDSERAHLRMRVEWVAAFARVRTRRRPIEGLADDDRSFRSHGGWYAACSCSDFADCDGS